jgi:hypothetical protein
MKRSKQLEEMLRRAAEPYMDGLVRAGYDPVDIPSPLEVMLGEMYRALCHPNTRGWGVEIASKLAKYMHPTLASIEQRTEIIPRPVNIVRFAEPVERQVALPEIPPAA